MTPMTNDEVTILYAVLCCFDVWGAGVMGGFKMERIRANTQTQLPVFFVTLVLDLIVHVIIYTTQVLGST